MKRGPAGLLLYPFSSRAENKDKFLRVVPQVRAWALISPAGRKKRPGTLWCRAGEAADRIRSG